MATKRAAKIVTDHDLGWRMLGRALRDASATAVEVGVRGESAERSDGGATNAEIATFHEFGTSRIPKRSFIRATYDANFAIYRAMARALGAQIVLGRTTKKKALTLIGMKMVSDVKARIRSGIPPELADSTKDAKGSSTPLIDTGQLIGAITQKVVRK